MQALRLTLWMVAAGSRSLCQKSHKAWQLLEGQAGRCDTTPVHTLACDQPKTSILLFVREASPGHQPLEMPHNQVAGLAVVGITGFCIPVDMIWMPPKPMVAR